MTAKNWADEFAQEIHNQEREARQALVSALTRIAAALETVAANLAANLPHDGGTTG